MHVEGFEKIITAVKKVRHWVAVDQAEVKEARIVVEGLDDKIRETRRNPLLVDFLGRTRKCLERIVVLKKIFFN